MLVLVTEGVEADHWRRVASGSTNRKGAYSFQVKAPARAGDYRFAVRAPAFRPNGKKSKQLRPIFGRIRIVTVAASGPPPGARSDWATLIAGSYHTCGVKTDGTAWCWGDNGDGELGDGTTTSSAVPVQVAGGSADWATLTAGSHHTCGVKTDHTAWCWGDSGYGQLGNGTTTYSTVPVQVAGGSADWATLTTGEDHTCGLKTNGTAWCWGNNKIRGLGSGTWNSSAVPVQAAGGSADWATLTAGYTHTCGLKTDHTAWCWGQNRFDQLGIGTPHSTAAPVQVAGGSTDWATITAGYSQTCGVKTDHTAWCWGTNQYGQLGNGGAVEYSLRPVQVAG
jgi:alpha-tubulin suppressor-like RCC1 family protein